MSRRADTAGLGTFLGAGDPGALDALYLRFLDDPNAVPRDLAQAFARLLEEGNGPQDSSANDWRRWGHLHAMLDPLVSAGSAAGWLPTHPLAAAYGGSIGWQIAHVPEIERRDWLCACAETSTPLQPAAERLATLEVLVHAEAFEQALQRHLPTIKRFGIEGAESFLLLCELILATSVAGGTRQVVCGGMHRGRLNLLAHFLGKPLDDLIAEMLGREFAEGGLEFSGDVAYHNGHSCIRQVGGFAVHLSMLPHPSHLSIIAPVTVGKARALQTLAGPDGRTTVLPLVMHTDAAFAGQGVIAETLQLARLPAFDVGGTVHLVLDNHLGFTTPPMEGRSTPHATDVAVGFGVPILHINGDDPDAIVRVASVAARYRARFHADVVAVLHGYRRHGHNEMDEPRFTQPMTYQRIETRLGIASLYAARLAAAGLDTSGAEDIRRETNAAVARAVAQAGTHRPRVAGFGGRWKGLRPGTEPEMTAFVDTGLSPDRLARAGRGLAEAPPDFTLHPKVEKLLAARRTSLDTGAGINWATAELLALASLADEGRRVRFGGQDSLRGAFGHRHLVLFDQATGRPHSLLAAHPGIEAFNTPLTELGVLAFEYGHSLAEPDTLMCWEAQFGDFLNLAQTVFDQFVSCGEVRWQRSSGLVLLLPHGLDGGGPDHSTGRPERLLAACAGANLQVANPSTPAQYFHLLRRQLLRPFRKAPGSARPEDPAATLRLRVCA